MIATCFNGDQLGVRSTGGVTKFAAATASHLRAIVSVVTPYQKYFGYYRAKLARFRSLSHLTTEVTVAAI